MIAWVNKELQDVDLGDRRLNRRLVKLVETLCKNPASSVPQACGSWAATKAAYRFWASENVKAEKIRSAHQSSVIRRLVEEEFILVAQDTTELNYTSRATTTGLGYLSNAKNQGLIMHSSLAISQTGVPLGLVHQEVWARDTEEKGKAKKRASLATKDKESQRWLNSLKVCQTAIPINVRVLNVGDREADIFDLFAEPRRPGSDLLIRARHNRRVEHEHQKMYETVRKTAISGQISVEIPRKKEQPPRQASLIIRFTTVQIRPPKRRSEQPIDLQVILAEEETLPPDQEPIRWWLLTTLPVTSLEDAEQCVQWYRYRWLIERYHFVLKSGCKVEELQLETAERLENALATYCIVAWHLLWLTYEVRQNPEAPCDLVLDEHQWQALYCTANNTPHPPPSPPSLHEAVLWIAKLGGFLARKSDGHPGVKTIWRGWRRLEDLTSMWSLTRPP